MPSMTKTPAQLDREVVEVLSANGKRPLYGHTSEATAYLVADYPYGFRERTQIRYWLEEKPKKGWRFVSQTLNPKTLRWNKPKASTYLEWAAAMYLDENGHVHWDGVGAYSDDQKILAFVRTFPGAKMAELRKVVPAKQRYLKDTIDGKLVWSVGGVKKPLTEADIERARGEMAIWEEIGAAIGRS
jgi:hypothetical protein